MHMVVVQPQLHPQHIPITNTWCARIVLFQQRPLQSQTVFLMWTYPLSKHHAKLFQNRRYLLLFRVHRLHTLLRNMVVVVDTDVANQNVLDVIECQNVKTMFINHKMKEEQ
jgi:hypothetical protein